MSRFIGRVRHGVQCWQSLSLSNFFNTITEVTNPGRILQDTSQPNSSTTTRFFCCQ